MTRKQFGYTIEEKQQPRPDYYGDYANRTAWLKFGEIGADVQNRGNSHFLEAVLTIRNDGYMSLAITAGGVKPERYANATALLSKAKLNEEGEITPQAFIDLVKKLPVYVFTYDWGNVPIESVGKTAFRLPYYIDNEQKYAWFFCDTQEQAKLHFMTVLTAAADLETMEKWGYNSFYLESSEIRARSEFVTIEDVLQPFGLSDCNEESLNRAKVHREEREREQAKYEEERKAKEEERRKAKEEAEKTQQQESESQEEVSA